MTQRISLLTAAFSAMVAGAPAAHAACTAASLTGSWTFISALDNSGTDSVDTCSLTINDTGRLSGHCARYTLGASAPFPQTLTGSFKVDAQCRLTGTFKPSTAPAAFAIRGGYLVGTQASMIITSGVPYTHVRLANMAKL